MKHWQELTHLLDRVLALGQAGRASSLAVVTAISGSAYRRPGARLLVDGDGGFLGGVSGGCLEEDVREFGLEVLRTEKSKILHYDTGSDETKLWGLGLGCDGEIDLLVQPIAPRNLDLWTRVRALLDGDRAFAVATMIEEGGPGDVMVVGEEGPLAGEVRPAALGAEVAAAAKEALRARRSGVVDVGDANGSDPGTGRAEGGFASPERAGARGGEARDAPRSRVFVEVLLPPPKLVICGAGDDARPTAAFAAASGFRVMIADHRPAYLTRERFPEAQRLFLLRPEETMTELPGDADTYVLVKSHSLMRDTAWVRRFIGTAAPYIGVLGPRARIAKILTALEITDAGQRARVFGPVGLDVGADGPEQVGISIVAELLAVRAGRAPQHLRARHEGIHTAAPAPVAAVVLAAGSSTRMGRNKLLLPLGAGDEPLLRRTVRTALEAGLSPVIVVLGHEPEAARAIIADLPCRVVLNPRHAEGKGTSLQAGLAEVSSATEAAAAVIMLGDMPFVTAGMLGELVARQRASSAPLVISRYGEVNAPPMLYTRPLFAELLGLPGKACGKEMIKRHRHEAAVMSWPDEALADVDVPDDYQRVRARVAGGAQRGERAARPGEEPA